MNARTFSNCVSRVAALASLAALAQLLAEPPGVQAQVADGDTADTGRLVGVVVDARGEPLSEVEIRLPDRDHTVETNAEGRFTLDGLPSGTLDFHLVYLGLFHEVTVDVAADEVTRRTYRLDVSAAEIENLGVEVAERTTKMSGFERRKDHASGRFITRDEIAETDPFALSDMLRGMPGLQVRSDGAGDRHVVMSRGADGCSPNLVVDGDPVEAFGVDDFRPEHVQAIEVYDSRLETPVQYRHDRCGAILLWIRDEVRER